MPPAPQAPPPTAPLPSATVLLLRDGARGLEVFMVVRHHQIDFASGALVFPGGKVDSSDQSVALHGRCAVTGPMEGEALACRVAAIREAFEECGVLLARPRGATALVAALRLAELDRRHRAALARHELGMSDLVEAEDLELACDLLVPFAHWITPDFLPKRFDTWFFLAEAPADHLAVHDGSESVDSRWLSPAEALAEAAEGRATLVFATRMNLIKLARSNSVAEAMAAARAEPPVTVCPELVEGDGGPVFRLPLAAGYGAEEFPAEGIPRTR